MKTALATQERLLVRAQGSAAPISSFPPLGGVPCSLLVFISRGTSKRNVYPHGIMGDPDSEVTKLSNLVLSRFCLLVLVAISRNVFWAIEQPSSSLLPQTPYYSYLLNLSQLNTVFIRMSAALELRD